MVTAANVTEFDVSTLSTSVPNSEMRFTASMLMTVPFGTLPTGKSVATGAIPAAPF